jgi:hypothetical protein
MLHERLDGDDHGLFRFVGDDETYPLLATATRGVALHRTLVLIQRRPFGGAGIQPSEIGGPCSLCFLSLL